MYLPRSTRMCAALAVLFATCCGGASGTEPAIPTHLAEQQTVARIENAVEQLRKDPNMGIERKVRTLKWKSGGENPADEDIPAWILWLQGLFGWIARSARMIIWILAATLAAFVVVYFLRLLRSRATSIRGDSFTAPSHVRDLDIRPESLPADIGAAALLLWEGGEQRRALSLLYRGLLSRMVHAHHVPVRDSTTEGECIALARRCLPVAARDFAAALVTTWQRAVYGELVPPTEQVRALCAGFGPSLDPADAKAIDR